MIITTASPSQTLYASADFMVENYPDLNAAELIRINRDGPPPSISSVIFKGMEAILFLGGFDNALHTLPEEDVEEQFLGRYASLMQRQLLQ